ncbi:MAG: hypothetical protein WC846_03575 [Candidatus Gracilibacteria bacterium]
MVLTKSLREPSPPVAAETAPTLSLVSIMEVAKEGSAIIVETVKATPRIPAKIKNSRKSGEEKNVFIAWGYKFTK